MKHTEEQRQALESLREVAKQRHWLQDEIDKQVERIEKVVRQRWEQEMAQAVTTAKDMGIATRQIGLAWGSKDYGTAQKLVEKYWKSDRV